jgi:hypothetical protein
VTRESRNGGHSAQKSNNDEIESVHDVDVDETQLLPKDCVDLEACFETNINALAVFTNGVPKDSFIVQVIKQEGTVPSLPSAPSSEISLKRAAIANPFENYKRVASGLPMFDQRMRNCVFVCEVTALLEA